MPSARRISWAKIRIFVVAVAAVSILTVLVYLLTGGTLLEPKTLLYVFIPDATGMGAKSEVRVNGITVGEVADVALSGSNQPDRVVRLTLQIEAAYLPLIPSDSFAEIDTDTAVGDKVINITRGRSATPTAPRAEVPFRPQPELLKTLDIGQFTQQLRMIEALLDDIESGKNPAGTLLLNDRLYNQVREQIDNIERDIRDLQNPKSPVGKMLYTDEDYRQIRDRIQAFDQKLADLQASKLLRDESQYTQLAAQLTELRQSIQKLQGGSLLQSEEMYRQWSRQLGALIASVDELNVNPLLSSSEMYDYLTGAATELRANVHEFRKNPEKFLRIKLF